MYCSIIALFRARITAASVPRFALSSGATYGSQDICDERILGTEHSSVLQHERDEDNHESSLNEEDEASVRSR